MFRRISGFEGVLDDSKAQGEVGGCLGGGRGVFAKLQMVGRSGRVDAKQKVKGAHNVRLPTDTRCRSVWILFAQPICVHSVVVWVNSNRLPGPKDDT